MRVALTFDAELPGREHADPFGVWPMLSILERSQVRTTWFMQGRWCRYQPRAARAAAKDGHLIGSHSFFHANMPMFHREGFRYDVDLAREQIMATTGVDPVPWFRCPNLQTSPDVEEWLAEMGYWQPVGADVIPQDWEPGVSADEIRRRVVDGITHGGGPIVLLHTWPRTTAEALPGILHDLAGCEFVGLDEL